MGKRFLVLLPALTLAVAVTAQGAGLSADEIVKKSHDVYGGDDAVATLNFKFHQTGEAERKLTYRMAWKKYDQGKFVRKVIFFTEFPPGKRGQAYMAWFYNPSLHKDDDEWIYLPDLREVRKVVHDDKDKEKEQDEFSKRSVLQDADLMPRSPGADKHRLLRTEKIDGKDYYVIENVPADAMPGMPGMGGMDMDYPYGKTITWIDSGNFLVTRVDYYERGGALVKREKIDWKKMGKAWVWREVTATDMKNRNETVLDVSDVRVNLDMSDNVFSERTMRLGLVTAIH